MSIKNLNCLICSYFDAYDLVNKECTQTQLTVVHETRITVYQDQNKKKLTEALQIEFTFSTHFGGHQRKQAPYWDQKYHDFSIVFPNQRFQNRQNPSQQDKYSSHQHMQVPS